MAERKDTDSLLMDWLYEPGEEQEPAEPEDEEVSAHQGELDSFRRVREAFRELPDEEPPPALTAILMHEAAKRAPARPARAATVERDDEERGFFAWLGRIFGTMMAHPAATAAATLLVVAGLAGSLYVRGHTGSEPQAGSAAPAPGAVADLERAETSAEPASEESKAAAAADPAADDLRLPYDNGYTVTLADGEREEARNREADADNATEKLEMASKKDTPAATRSAPQKKTSASKQLEEVQANVISGADPLISADDEDAVTSVSRGNSARDQKPAAGAPAAPPPQQQQWDRNASDGDRGGAESAPPPDTWAQDKHAQLVDEARRDQCAAAARTANDIRERSPAYYDDHVAGSEAYKRCSSTIVAERKRRVERRSRETAAEPADQPAAEPSGN